MDKVEKPTEVRVKSSFSIENILSRPDRVEQRRKLYRMNPFENNHVLFHGGSNNINNSNNNNNKHLMDFNQTNLQNSENHESFDRKIEKDEESEEFEDDHETSSEVLSNDGSEHNNCKFVFNTNVNMTFNMNCAKLRNCIKVKTKD